NPISIQNNKKNKIINKLLIRFKGVLSAKNYKYVMMNAPEKFLPRIRKTIPGLKSPTISPLAKEGWISIQSVIKEDIFWETIERLKKIGASDILVLPVEKLII
ncbi:MAG: ATP phosphoribosyltransferase, partial [bacterium]|nr:ATP phosphoribosyltransferase [bacterium]